MTEDFTAAERARLDPRFTNLDRPCFALRNLPETVKGALFARYSRSPKPLRRLYLDEFDADLPPAAGADGADESTGRAAALYGRVLGQYGDDSVAQLGSAHVACEGVSNVLTKVLERGRLMSYLEQSTRYVPYTERPGGRWKYVTPAEIDDPTAAWGRPPGKQGEARARRVLELLTAAGDVYRLGPATRDGHPPHPLYLPASEAATPLQLHAPRRPEGAPEPCIR